MTRVLHLITGRDTEGLPLSAAAQLAALPGVAGLQLAANGWMTPAPDGLDHEDLRLREASSLRLSCMAELLLRDHGARSMPVLVAPSLDAASLTEVTEALLSWAEVLATLADAFRQAGHGLHLTVWRLQMTDAEGPAPLADLVTALAVQGFAAEAGGLLQPDPASDLAGQLRAARLVTDLTGLMAAKARAAGLALAARPVLRAHILRQLAHLETAGFLPDPASPPEARDALAERLLHGLISSPAPIEGAQTT